MSSLGVQLEQFQALQDIQDKAREYGEPVIIYFRKESDVRRDKYNTIKAVNIPGVSATMQTYTNDKTQNPNDRKLDSAGIREHCDVLIWTPAKDWIDQGFTFNDLDVNRDTVIFQGYEWKISDKGIPYNLGDVSLYVTIGLKRN